jgi:hypothetical protein
VQQGRLPHTAYPVKAQDRSIGSQPVSLKCLEEPADYGALGVAIGKKRQRPGKALLRQVLVFSAFFLRHKIFPPGYFNSWNGLEPSEQLPHFLPLGRTACFGNLLFTLAILINIRLKPHEPAKPRFSQEMYARRIIRVDIGSKRENAHFLRLFLHKAHQLQAETTPSYFRGKDNSE